MDVVTVGLIGIAMAVGIVMLLIVECFGSGRIDCHKEGHEQYLWIVGYCESWLYNYVDRVKIELITGMMVLSFVWGWPCRTGDG